MPYPKPFCFFDLDVNSTLDNEKLQSLLDEYRDYKLPKSHNYLFYSMKPVIDKNSLQLMYLISPKVDDYNANLFIWNSKSINSLQKYDFFYMKSNTSPYYMLSSFCSVKHVYFEILDKVENKEEFQKELINTLKYLSNSLETIEITFDDCHEFVNTLCDNFTSFRKLKALRLNFTSPLPADLSIKLIATLAEYGESLERLNLINIMTGGKIQIIDFLRVINRSKRLVELDMNFVTGDYIEPHLPKVLSEYTNMIDVKLELDWCITQSMVNDFVTLIKNLTSLCALSLEFDFRDELDFNEFFETVIDAPKLQLFGFFLDAKKNNKTLDLDMFERLLKKQLKYLRLALPIDPEGESFINNTLISGAYNYFNSCQEFSLKVYGIDFKPMFENYLSLFIQPSIQMKAWELKIESDPADVESYAYYFVNNLPKSKSKKLVLKFSDSEKVVNTEKLIKNLQVAKKKGKYHSLLFNNKVYLTIEC